VGAHASQNGKVLRQRFGASKKEESSMYMVRLVNVLVAFLEIARFFENFFCERKAGRLRDSLGDAE